MNRALPVVCSTCKEPAGAPCRTLTGRATNPHSARLISNAYRSARLREQRIGDLDLARARRELRDDALAEAKRRGWA